MTHGQTIQRTSSLGPLQRGRRGGGLSAPGSHFLYGLAFPLGWLQPPDYERTLELVQHPVARLVLFLLCFLSLFHWAHRFRFTLYDGLQIKHLNPAINLFCYGGAVTGTVAAAYLLWTLP